MTKPSKTKTTRKKNIYKREYTCYKCACGNTAAPLGKRKMNGILGPRIHPETGKPWCPKCKTDYEAQGAGYNNHLHKLESRAIEEGYISLTHSKNIKNNNYKSFKYFSPECANRNGHLGVKCMIDPKIQDFAKEALNEYGKLKPEYKDHELKEELKLYLDTLTVDHKDGNAKNNFIENLQTFCMICHKKKTIDNGDHRTEGTSKKERSNGKIIWERSKVK